MSPLADIIPGRCPPGWKPLTSQPGCCPALDLVTSIMKGMTAAATKILEKFTCPLPVDEATDTAIRAHFQQRRAAAPQPMPAETEASGCQSTFDWLGQWVQSPQKDDQWVSRPKMMPRKVDRGCQQC